MNRTITAIPAVAAITAILLAGCVGAGPELPVVVPTDPIEVPVSPSPEPTEEQETVTLPENAEPGLEIPESLAQELNRDQKDDFRGYLLPDGTWQLIKLSEPLPEAVVADAQRKADAVPVTTGNGDQDQTAHGSNTISVASQLSLNTGKRVVVIAYGSIWISGVGPGMGWIAGGAPFNSERALPVGTSLDAVRAEVDVLIAQQENPDEWIVFVQS